MNNKKEEKNKKIEGESIKEIKNISLKVFELDEDRNINIEKKAEILLGFLGLIIPAIVLLFFNIKDLIPSNFLCVSKIFFFITISCLIVTAIFSIFGLIVRTFKQIDLNKIYESELNKAEISEINEIRRRLIKHILKIHNHNKQVIDNKATNIRRAFIWMTISTSLIALFYIILIIHI